MGLRGQNGRLLKLHGEEDGAKERRGGEGGRAVAAAMTTARKRADDYADADEAISCTTSGDNKEAGPPLPPPVIHNLLLSLCAGSFGARSDDSVPPFALRDGASDMSMLPELVRRSSLCSSLSMPLLIRESPMYYFTTIGISAIMCVRSYIINQVHVPY